jgi:hypothetical protein
MIYTCEMILEVYSNGPKVVDREAVSLRRVIELPFVPWQGLEIFLGEDESYVIDDVMCWRCGEQCFWLDIKAVIVKTNEEVIELGKYLISKGWAYEDSSGKESKALAKNHDD